MQCTGLCVVGDVFRMGLKGQACPLERAQIDVSSIPLYPLINRPKLSRRHKRIAEQHTDGLSGEESQKHAYLVKDVMSERGESCKKNEASLPGRGLSR